MSAKLFHERSRLTSFLFAEIARRIGKKELEEPIGISDQLMSSVVKDLAVSIRVQRCRIPVVEY